MMKSNKFKIALTALLGLSLSMTSLQAVKIGVLHSLSGTMAISETSLRDAQMMAVKEINESGGVLGEQVEAVVVDPASDWPLFAEKAKQLINDEKVAVTFGCWTSVSRKSCLPGIRGGERPVVLSCAIRRGGTVPQRLLHRGFPEPTTGSCGRVHGQ